MFLKPGHLNCVPTFDGNPLELNRYLAICESNSHISSIKVKGFTRKYLAKDLKKTKLMRQWTRHISVQDSEQMTNFSHN